MDKERLRDLLWEATADCHDDDEAFWGIFYTLAEEGLSFPLKARALGELVEVVDLDGASSSLGRGIVALVRKGDQEYSVLLPSKGSAGVKILYRTVLKHESHEGTNGSNWVGIRVPNLLGMQRNGPEQVRDSGVLTKGRMARNDRAMFVKFAFSCYS